MKTSLVLTVIAPDKPGLVEALAETIASRNANWLESRMAHLAGQFAGILRVEAPDDQAQGLIDDLNGLGDRGLRVMVEASDESEPVEGARIVEMELVGMDREGIVRDISHALASLSVNVEELSSERTSAPMSAEMLFKAEARLRIPAGLSLDDLHEMLEQLGHDMQVEISLDDAGA
ncbi:MAG: glycine cleavage system transcriptional repressor [Planctomycetota bacterium]|jgi:glycine cleavage system regulatory protein